MVTSNVKIEYDPDIIGVRDFISLLATRGYEVIKKKQT